MVKSNLIKSLRPHFWLLSVLPGGVGLFLSSGALPFREFILVVIILSAGSGIAELVNNYVDQDLDKCQKVKKLGVIALSGGSGIILDRIKKWEVLSIAGLLIVVAITGSVLINIYVLLLTLIGLFMAIGYSLDPIRFKSRGALGIFDMAFGRGFISFHIGWLAYSLPSANSIAIGGFLTLLTFGTASLAHLADYTEDKLLNIRTFPVMIGFEKSAQIAAGAIAVSLLFLASISTSHLATVNILIFPLAVLGLVLAYFLVTIKAKDTNSVSLIQVLGIILFTLALFVFV